MKRWQSPWLWLLLVVALLLLVRGTTAVTHIRHNFSAIPRVAAVHGLDYVAGRGAVAPDPDHPLPAVEARSLAYLALLDGDPATAERWLLSADPTDATHFLTQFELCKLTWQQDRRAEALAACQSGQIPAAYWIRLGLAAVQGQNPALAVDYFGMATAVEPNNAEAWYRLARTQMDRDQHAAAIAAYEQARTHGYELTPGFFNGLGEAFVLTGQLDAARTVFEEGVVAFPDSRVLYNDLASVYARLGQTDLADAWYTRLLDRWPDAAYAWAARGGLALETGDVATAVFTYEQAVSLAPDKAAYWMGLGDAYRGLGDDGRAAAAYSQTLKLDPDNAVAQQQLDSLTTAPRTPEDSTP